MRLILLVVALSTLLAGCAAPLSGPGADVDGDGAFALDVPEMLPSPAGASAEPHVAVRDGQGGLVTVVGTIEYVPGDAPHQDSRFTLFVHRRASPDAPWESAELPRDVLAPFDPDGVMNYMGDPVFAYAPDGTLYLGGVAAHGAWKEAGGIPVLVQLNDLTVFLTKSSDDGATWAPAVFHQRGAGTFGFPVFFAGILEDKEWVTVGPDGVVHYSWTTFTNTQSAIRYTRSTDGGASWSEPLTLIETAPTDTVGVQASTVAAPGGDRVYVSASISPFREDGQRGPASGGHQIVWVSEDNGASFAPPQEVGPAGDQRWGIVFADPADPLHAFVTAPTDAEDSRVWLAETRDGGASWSDPLPLAPARSGTQQQPTGRVDAAGRAHVAYYDAGWPDGERLVVAVVEDGRVAFEAAADAPPTAPGVYRRDYFGIAGLGDESWVVWVQGNEADGTAPGLVRLARGAA